jgi:uncharacterized protein (TIGR03000 family)
MRKTFCILCLIAVTLFATANEAFAQRRGGGGGRGGRGGYSRGYGGYGYGRGYGYYGGLGFYYGGPYYYGNGGYYYAPDSYAGPSYYSGPVVQAPPTDARTSFYPADPNVATIAVHVPNADAQVWFDDAATSQRGMDRTFETPALQQQGTYTIKARWMENGRPVDQQRQVRVQPGQSVIVNFQAPPSEGIAPPQPPKK